MRDQALRCFAVAAPGLELLVAGELAALGIDARIQEGGVAWEGNLESVYQANLWLRTATRVIVRMARFRATTFWELERRAGSVPWSSVVRPGSTVTFRVTTKKSKLYHSDAVAERLGKSIVAAVPGVKVVGSAAAAVDDEDDAPDSASQLLVVRIARDELTLSADSSGEPLYRRGYRQALAKAPLRETLAAAVLMVSGWVPGEPLLDPFCGSGTIPLEAALMSGRIAPGIATSGRTARRFAFTAWPGFKEDLLRQCVEDARLLEQEIPPGRIRGSDRDAGAIAAAKANSERAGLAGDVEFETASVSALVPPGDGSGWIATNPPYGMRIGDRSDVRRLYAAFGRAVRERAPGFRLAMLSPDPRLDGIVASELRTPLEERVRTKNGGIPVRIVATQAAG